MTSSTAATSWRSDTRLIVVLALPLILTNFAHVALTTIDIVVLGLLGPAEVAAGGLAIALFNQFRTMGTGLVTGVSNLVAEANARQDEPAIRRLVAAGFLLATAAGVVFTALLMLLERPLVWLGQDPQVAHQAVRFLAVAAPGLLPCLWFQTLRHFTVGLKRPGPLLAITLVSIGFTAGLNYVLVFGKFGLPALGLMGVAASTSLVFLLSFLMFAAVVSRRKDLAPHLSFAIWRVDRGTLASAWRLGVPIAATYGSEAGFFSVLTLLIGTLGVEALAAQTVVNQIIYIVFMISAGISHAASIHISEACSRAHYQHARRLGRLGLALGAAAMVIVAVPYLTVPTAIVSLFLGGSQAVSTQTMELAVGGLAIAALLQVFDCSQNVGNGILRGAGDATGPFKLSLLGYWLIGLPGAYLLGVHWHLGVYGVWAGLTLGLAATALLLLIAFESRLSRLDRTAARSQVPLHAEPA